MLSRLRKDRTRLFFTNVNQVIGAAVTGYINFIIVSNLSARLPIFFASTFAGFFTGKDSFFQRFIKNRVALLFSDWLGILWRTTHTIFSILVSLTLLAAGIANLMGKNDMEKSDLYQNAPYYNFAISLLSAFILASKLIYNQTKGVSSSGFSEKPFIKASNRTAEIARFIHYFFYYNENEVGSVYLLLMFLLLPSFISTYLAYKFKEKPIAKKFQTTEDAAISTFNFVTFFEALYTSIALEMTQSNGVEASYAVLYFYLVPAFIFSTTYGILQGLSFSGEEITSNASNQKSNQDIEMTTIHTDEATDERIEDKKRLMDVNGSSSTLDDENLEDALEKLELGFN